MASLSLPRVLQLKKNSLDAEREQFEKFQTLAIQKAINSIETPVKEKHVRSTIIGTFQEQSACTYWMVAIRQPLQDNRIVSWKFCHVTHKLLREGHPACLDDSQRHIGMIENLGKLWVHLREGYGRLISLYSNLLVTKLKFHARNPRFPGNMMLTADELDAIAENDVNNYFQLCVELFDYMEDILTLQAAVFDSLGNARANSMTASGQCRLAALIPCAQDSSHIYDCNVRLLFRLHAALPPDVLAGHRERFRQQFKKLSSFYKHASSLQYYRNLLTLPVLPSNPPNFLLQSDFGTYVAPVVSIPEQPPDEVDAVGSLIDTSDTFSQTASPEQEARAPPADPLVERDRLIEHLQNELKRMRLEVSQIIQERNTMLGSMREHCTRMESQLRATRNELEEEKQKMDILSVETPEIKKKLTQTEERAKILDEKFQKLKGAYTQLREEHITLIRQKAEVDKNASSLRAAAAQHESAKTMLQQQLNDRMKDVELLQQSASSSEEIEAYKSELTNLRSELEQARQKEVELETLRASIEALEIEHKTATTELEVKFTAVTNELKDVTENNEKLKQEISEKDIEYSKVREELISLRQKSGDEYKKAVEEREDALKQLSELKEQYQHEKQELETIVMGLKDIQLKSHDQIEQALKANIELEATFKQEIENIKSQYERTNFEKDNEIKILTEKLELDEDDFKKISTSQTEEINKCKTQIEELEQLRTKEREEYTRAMSESETEVQLIEARLEHTESERLNAECELQDLLQQNTILEADMGSLKIQLEDAKQAVKKQASRLVSCAGETALEVINGAQSAFENSNAQDANNLAAELAIKALEELAKTTRVEGKEEDVAKSAIFAAHNAAKLSAYIADLSNVTTDVELADKMNTECRNMLTSTKQCLESLAGGGAEAASAQARGAVAAALSAALGAERPAARAVDDELAHMDRAIEAAAAQIEKMLAASRAGDTGIKLEVNEKILDACTTLMAAVKILVQDSRKLQNELGDPKTRQKMYRRNPQWSEGLISASKAVVFAAKLLVTSADEAVGAAGRAEGVSAAAHEVAASTAQLVAASRAKAPPAAPALASLTAASRAVAAAAGAVVACVRGASALVRDQEALDTSALSLTATRRLEMESKVRALELESALDAERARLAALRKRHYHLAQLHENGKVTNGEE